tara:strand:- start:4608 stop:5084 length:477 start_codon:yes stop_codon:yes gene_type:complete
MNLFSVRETCHYGQSSVNPDRIRIVVDRRIYDNCILDTQPISIGFVLQTIAVYLGSDRDNDIANSKQANLRQLHVRKDLTIAHCPDIFCGKAERALICMFARLREALTVIRVRKAGLQRSLVTAQTLLLRYYTAISKRAVSTLFCQKCGGLIVENKFT